MYRNMRHEVDMVNRIRYVEPATQHFAVNAAATCSSFTGACQTCRTPTTIVTCEITVPCKTNLAVLVVVVSLIITLSTAKLHQFCRLKLYEVKYNISLNDVHI